MTSLREGSGADLVVAIREAPRALVFISVPWSVPERRARQVFRTAIAELERRFPALAIQCFRLDVDEDEVAQRWLSSVGCLHFAGAGAGSLVWLEAGQMLSSELAALVLGVEGVIARSTSLWSSRAAPKPGPA